MGWRYRKRQKLIRKGAELIAGGEALKTQFFVQSAREEIASGRVRGDEEWGKQWEATSDTELFGVFNNYADGLNAVVNDADERSAIQEAIRTRQPLPQIGDPVAALLARRVQWLVRTLNQRQGGSSASGSPPSARL
jgi:hypothetical protein